MTTITCRVREERAVQLFYLERFEDVHGQSGVGIVAEGCLFSDGSAVLRWVVEPQSTVMREPREGVNGMQQFVQIHGHGGRTKLRLGRPPRECRRWERRVRGKRNA